MFFLSNAGENDAKQRVKSKEQGARRQQFLYLNGDAVIPTIPNHDVSKSVTRWILLVYKIINISKHRVVVKTAQCKIVDGVMREIVEYGAMVRCESQTKKDGAMQVIIDSAWCEKAQY
jgi:hypothetical protein